MSEQLIKSFELCRSTNRSYRKQAEEIIKTLSQDINYPLHLLNFIWNHNSNMEYQQRASLEFKYFCEKINLFSQNDILQIIKTLQQNIISVLMVVQKKIFVQLLLGVRSLYSCDNQSDFLFLVKEIKNRIQEERSLKILNSLLKRYSDGLDYSFEELEEVCEEIANSVLEMVEQGLQSNLYQAKQGFKIFYKLNSSNMNHSFQIQIDRWNKAFINCLNLQNNHIQVLKCKGSALQSMILVNQVKNNNTILAFSLQIFQQIQQVSQKDDPENEKILINCLKYFKQVLGFDQLKETFSQNISDIITLILPLFQISEVDNDIFYNEPESFINIFFEFSDTQSKRYHASQLMRQICKNYSEQFQNYLQNLVIQNTRDQEIQLINLMIDTGVKSFIPNKGIIEYNFNPQFIQQFYHNIIKQYLQNIYLNLQEKNYHKIQIQFLVYCLRFIDLNRQLIPLSDLQQLIKVFVLFLKISNDTIRFSACYVIQHILVTIETDILEIAEQLSKEILNNISDISLDMYSLKLVKQLIILLKQNSNQIFQLILEILQIYLKYLDQQPYNIQYMVYDSLAILYVNINEQNKLQFFQVIQQNLAANQMNQELCPFVTQLLTLSIPYNNLQNYYENLCNVRQWDSENINQIQANLLFIEKYIAFNNQSLYNLNLQLIINFLIEQKQDQILIQFIKNIIQNINQYDIFKSKTLELILITLQNNYFNSKVL